MTMSAELELKLGEALRGVARMNKTARGLSLSRLPEWTYPQHAHAPIVAKMAERLSGVHIDIETAATKITVTYRSLRDSNPSTNWISGPSTIAVTTEDFEQNISHSNGDLRVWNFDVVEQEIEGEDSVAEFELPATNTPRLVQIWLPQNCPIELISIEANDEWQPPSSGFKPLWLHYGSSISHCEDADGPLGVWQVAAARELDLDVYNLGLGGCANLEQFAARTIRDMPAKLISLKLGINVVNNASYTSRTFGPAVHGFIDTIRDAHKTTPILVISPICCPAHENNPGPSETDANGMVKGQEFSRHSWIGELTLRGIREILTEVVAQRSATDPNIHYMDGLHLFNETEALTMPDGIHPDAAGYRTIAANFVERVPREWLS
ncbi:MAG: hypothetical protein K9G66_02160 [Rhodoluna sp.]|nr:hypothetical protein [Rhodoluna sp.]